MHYSNFSIELFIISNDELYLLNLLLILSKSLIHVMLFFFMLILIESEVFWSHFIILLLFDLNLQSYSVILIMLAKAIEFYLDIIFNYFEILSKHVLIELTNVS
jgi:hypothetical protein